MLRGQIISMYQWLLFVKRSVNLVHQSLDEGDLADEGQLDHFAGSSANDTHDRNNYEEDVAEAEQNVEYVIDTAVDVEAVVVGSGGQVDDEKNDALNDEVSEVYSKECSAFLYVELAVLGILLDKEGDKEEKSYV